MSKLAQLNAALLGFMQQPNLSFTTGKVVSIQDNTTCTVEIDGLQVPDVRLRATKVKDSTGYLQATPGVGTHVLVGSLSGDLRELAVLAMDSLATLEMQATGLHIKVNAEQGTLEATALDSDKPTASVQMSKEGTLKATAKDNTTIEMSGEGIVFNGGQLGGLVEVGKMVSWMSKVSADLATLKTMLATTAVAGNGAPLAIVFEPTATTPQKTDFENTKVKH